MTDYRASHPLLTAPSSLNYLRALSFTVVLTTETSPEAPVRRPGARVPYTKGIRQTHRVNGDSEVSPPLEHV